MLTLSHSPAEGTLLQGTTRGDAPKLKEAFAAVRHVAVWRWSSNLDAWFIQRSRDRQVRRYQLDETATALRAVGFEVEIVLGAERRSVAEQEADRAGRAAARVDRLEGRAATLKASGEAGWAAAREYASRIPMGQPILVDHYSAPRHRRDLARIDRMEDRAIDQLKAGDDAAYRAAAAEANQRHRVHGGTTMRRLAKLEADLRRAQRNKREDLVDDLEEQVTYWREYLRGLADAGVFKVWTREDFTKGDYVLFRFGWAEVLRVNAKSVSIPHIHAELAEYGHTSTITYDDVQGRRSAEEHAAELAKRKAPAQT